MLVKRKKRPKARPDKQVLPARPEPSVEERERFSARAAANREDCKKRWDTGQPVIWCEPNRITAKQREAARNETQKGEREIDEILLMNSRPQPAGRKSDPAYDKAAYRRRISEISGKHLSVRALARDILVEDQSLKECKLDKMKQALKRRKKKHPPKY
jgi:hypothetical protein